MHSQGQCQCIVLSAEQHTDKHLPFARPPEHYAGESKLVFGLTKHGATLANSVRRVNRRFLPVFRGGGQGKRIKTSEIRQNHGRAES
jgi:hypothetical protein